MSLSPGCRCLDYCNPRSSTLFPGAHIVRPGPRVVMVVRVTLQWLSAYVVRRWPCIVKVSRLVGSPRISLAAGDVRLGCVAKAHLS